MEDNAGRSWLPLFPLGSVLFPGQVLPLHIFEPRYRALIADLIARPPARRQFGVIGIREGHEVGAGNVRALYDIGCAARLVQHVRHDDGGFDIVTVGTRRFRAITVNADAPLLRAEVEWLQDPTEPSDEARVAAVRVALADYRDHVLGRASAPADAHSEDPVALSFRAANEMLLDRADRQSLLEAASVGDRLKTELRLLRRETALSAVIRSIPAGDLAGAAVTLN